ncbi:hypothetical protein EC973_006278 [Apophysomyces ossiformis]|uniref:Ras GEF n=1 Tax=Apophysomyces ossiformis TaxID=679940 RepID=A0A8H7BRB6_9FUNG|nr:hypothetical protein EC973_006278 [Apophysomyces ossiformis]
MANLFDAYASPTQSNIQLKVFHIASSVRILLQSTTHSLTDGHYAFPDEGQQRKAVLKALSKLIQKSTEIQKSEQNKADDQLRNLANHLWMETLVFEEILQATISRRQTLMTLEKAARPTQPRKLKQSLPDTDYVLRRLQYHRNSIEDLVTDDMGTVFASLNEEASFSNEDIDKVKSLLLTNISDLISMVESLSRQLQEKKDTQTDGDRLTGEIGARHIPELGMEHILGSEQNESGRPRQHADAEEVYLHYVFHEYDDDMSFLKQKNEIPEDQIIFNADGQVMGATTEALIEWLTWPEKSPDPVFVCAFFHNFRLFMDPSEFLNLLMKRFRLDEPTSVNNLPLSEEELRIWESRILSPVRLAVCNVLQIWVEKYFDREQDINIKTSLLEFVQDDLTKSFPDSAKQLKSIIEQKFSETEPECTRSKEKLVSSRRSKRESTTLTSDCHPESSTFVNNYYPSPHITRPLKNMLRKALSNQDSSSFSNVTLYRLDPLEVARQLTLMESALFCRIHPNEILAAQESRKTVSKSANVKTMIQRSTQIVYWISNTILREPDAKRRVNVIKYWIKVGDHCLQLNNYNTLMAIRCALSSASIARLKQTWDAVSRSAKHKTIFDNISRVADSQRNFAVYRKCLKTATAPCLPFLGIYLSDMVFIDQGNPNHRTSNHGQLKLINFDKYMKMARILTEIDQFQVPYKFKEVDEIQRYISQCLKTETADNNEEAFYSRSLEIEPRTDDSPFIHDSRSTEIASQQRQS